MTDYRIRAIDRTDWAADLPTPSGKTYREEGLAEPAAIPSPQGTHMTDTTVGPERRLFEAWYGQPMPEDQASMEAACWWDSWEAWRARAALEAQDSERALADRLAEELLIFLGWAKAGRLNFIPDSLPFSAEAALAAYREARKDLK